MAPKEDHSLSPLLLQFFFLFLHPKACNLHWYHYLLLQHSTIPLGHHTTSQYLYHLLKIVVCLKSHHQHPRQVQTEQVCQFDSLCLESTKGDIFILWTAPPKPLSKDCLSGKQIEACLLEIDHVLKQQSPCFRRHVNT
jgi:hypothetical protein